MITIQHSSNATVCHIQLDVSSYSYIRWTNVDPTLKLRLPIVQPSTDTGLIYVSMLYGKRIQAAYASAEYIHCPIVGTTNDSQQIQSAYNSVDYIH